MASALFATDSIREVVESLDWNEVARRTIESAEEYMPGAAYLSHEGEVGYAETLGEVDGLLIATAKEVTGDEGEDELPYELSSWVGRASSDAAARAMRAFEVIYRELS